MKQLRIYFKNEDLDQISWCYLADEAMLQQGESLDPSLKKLAQTANEVVFIMPQNWVYETNINVAEKNAKQLLSAAAYQLEDQLAEDVDDLHFAQGQEQDNLVPFIAIKHLIMQRIAEFEKNNQITATNIINEMSLCATAENDEVNVYLNDQHFLFKSSDNSKNTLCPESQIDFFIDHLKRQNSDIVINRLDQKQDDFLCLPIDLTNHINLKQKDYSTGHVWQAIAKSLALPLVLMSLLGFLFVFNIWQTNQVLGDQIQNIQAKQSVLLKRSLPGYSGSGNAKRSLIKALQKQQGEEKQSGFMAMFHQFLLSKKKVKGIQLVKVDFKKLKLLVDVSANNLQQLDQLIIALKEYFKVTVSQMDSSNNESQGRFILEQR